MIWTIQGSLYRAITSPTPDRARHRIAKRDAGSRRPTAKLQVRTGLRRSLPALARP